MGEVYRARDLRLRREVAVKVLPEAVASSPDRLARFEREARTVAGLNHPNIVTLHSVEDEDGVRFLTMELVEGQTLSNLVTPSGLPLSRVLELSIPLADALVAAHERGVIHRDLKPGNVMVTREGRVKVLDFGLAKMEGTEDFQSAEQTATIVAPDSGQGNVSGTVPYMAPEQVRGQPVDARSDLFALGIILYELASGRRPFTGATPADVASAILRDTPEPLASARPDLPSDLVRIVSRCLEKNPRERFQTALDVCNDLRRLKQIVERGAGPTQTPQEIASVAVLPFVNRSRDEEDEYFSDGLADELITVLAKIRGLRVAARSSAFTFKGKEAPVAEVGKALKVTTVLDGTVRKAGNRVRISVQLVKVSDGYHLWSETYDRTLEDIFAVQDDIAQSVVRELRATLLGEETDPRARNEVMAEVARAAKGRGTNPEAHRLYLQGRFFVDRLTREDNERGVRYLRQALEIEPGFALAWTALALAEMRGANAGWAPIPEAVTRARSALECALSSEPDLAEAHAVMGWLQLVYDLKFREAAASIRRALELAPGNLTVLRVGAESARNLGRFQEAVELARRAVEQDPLSGTSYNILGLTLSVAGMFEEAESVFRKALELTPERVGTHAGLALVFLAQGRGDAALEAARQEPDEAYRLWALAIVEHLLGHGADSEQALRELAEKYAEDSAYQIAEAHASRGERDAAFEWLERAHEQRDAGLITELRSSRFLTSLHDDPRWAAFLRKLGFEE